MMVGTGLRCASAAPSVRLVAAFKEQFVAATAAKVADPTATSAEALGEAHSDKTLATE